MKNEKMAPMLELERSISAALALLNLVGNRLAQDIEDTSDDHDCEAAGIHDLLTAATEALKHDYHAAYTAWRFERVKASGCTR